MAKPGRVITFNNKTQTISKWAKELGISYHTLWFRLQCSDWSLEDALTTAKNCHCSSVINRRLISYKGRSQCLLEWSRELKISYGTLHRRIQSKWRPRKAFVVPEPVELCQHYPLDAAELPHDVERGYCIYDSEKGLGEVYKLNHQANCWTHSLVFNLSHPPYSQFWRTRWEAIADLVGRVPSETQQSSPSFSTNQNRMQIF